jgi:hypothetical protein
MGFDFSAAAKLTDDQLKDELAKHTPLTQDEINDLLPDRQDMDNYVKLLKIVQDATDANLNVAALQASIGAVGSVVMKLLRQYLPTG